MRLEALLAAIALRYLDQHGGVVPVTRDEAVIANTLMRPADRARWFDGGAGEAAYDGQAWRVKDPRKNA